VHNYKDRDRGRSKGRGKIVEMYWVCWG